MNAFDVLEGMLALEHNGKSLNFFLNDNGVKKVAIYGFGRVGVRVYEALRNEGVDIQYIIDRDADNIEFDGLKIIHPEELDDTVELIIVTTMEHFYSIKGALRKITKADVVSIGDIIEYCLAGEEDIPKVRRKESKKDDLKSTAVYCSLHVSDMHRCLDGRVILVTGGSSGIGRAVVKKICHEGGTAIAVGRNAVALQELSKETGCKNAAIDLGKIDNYGNFFEVLEKRVGNQHIDSFVNNAGIYIERNYGEYSQQDFTAMLDINLKAAYFLLQSFIQYCRKWKIKGNSVYTGSIRGMWGDPGLYGIMKSAMLAAVMGCARLTANEGIRVNAVSPGMTASGINGLNSTGNLYNEIFLGHRTLTPEEIAESIIWLLSEYSACITGANIPCALGSQLVYVR